MSLVRRVGLQDFWTTGDVHHAVPYFDTCTGFRPKARANSSDVARRPRIAGFCVYRLLPACFRLCVGLVFAFRVSVLVPSTPHLGVWRAGALQKRTGSGGVPGISHRCQRGDVFYAYSGVWSITNVRMHLREIQHNSWDSSCMYPILRNSASGP